MSDTSGELEKNTPLQSQKLCEDSLRMCRSLENLKKQFDQ